MLDLNALLRGLKATKGCPLELAADHHQHPHKRAFIKTDGCMFSGATASGTSISDSGELSASANRGGGNSGVEEYHAKNASIGSVPVGGAETSNSTWRTDRAIAGFGTTRSDSLSSLGKCLASPKPKSLTGYLTHLAETSLPQSSSLNWLGFGVVLLLIPRFLSIQQGQRHEQV